MSDDELRVHKDIGREDQRCRNAVAKLNTAGLGKESGHEAEKHQHPECAEEVGHPGGEIVLGLACEEGQGDEDAESEDQGLQDDAAFVEAGDDGDAVGF